MKSQHKRILVINDETNFLNQFKQWLNFYGYETEIVETGESGLSLIKEKFFDLVFLDYHLKKEKDGAKTASNFIPLIRQINDSLPIIVTSATHIDLNNANLKADRIEYLNGSFWDRILQITKSFIP